MQADDGHQSLPDGDLPDGCLLDGRYRLGGLIGKGGAAVVHEAVDTVLGRRVAVKLYRAADPVGRYRFGSEARLLASLSHPRLVTVYDVCLDGDQPFLVLELVDGPTLRDLMNPGPFGYDVVARLGTALAEALAYVHSRDVVHRDVKPSNILVAPSGEPLLSDFGLARVLSGAHLTRTGEYVGTAAYLAPEQITDADVGPPADIYALGLVLLECLTGHPEYSGSAAETALARLSRPPRMPESLPPSWRTVLAAMTAQNPAERPTATRCAEWLAALGEGRAEPAIPLPRPVGRHDQQARLRPVHAGLAALALAAVAAVATTSPNAIPGHPTSQQPAPVPETSRTTVPAAPVVPVEDTGELRTDVRVPPPEQTAPPRQTAPPAQTAAPAGQAAPPVGPGENRGNGSNGENNGKGKGNGKG
ncbi:serine/threonine-protein kinase [Actinophytocola glycyrrhizae]|uniref:non-specific serine/threonine protein kinase n=1 Tax=Actinophytocola glycyrrhizae TaxID=2044873 RepID=A0ABV9RW07_9PSEU